MRLIWKAIRAVTVETIGVVAVVWILFAAAGWTMQSAGVEPRQEAGRAWNWFGEVAGDIGASVKPTLDGDEREQYVEQRLAHYSRAYKQAAGHYVRSAVGDLASETPAAEAADAQRSSRLLGLAEDTRS